MSRRGGFSLVELMLVMVIMGMIGIFVGQALSANEAAYQAVDQTTESQQQLRAILDIMERDVRHAAVLMPESASACGVDETTLPDTLYLADGSAIDPGDDTDEYPALGITAGTVAAGTHTLTLSGLVVETGAPARPAYDADGDGANDSDFRVGGGAIVYEPDNPDKGTTCGRITAINVGGGTITVVLKGGIVGGVGPYAVVPANEYRIAGTNLLWNGIRLAGNIEDLQVAWIFDTDGDNIEDAGEVYGIPAKSYASTGTLANLGNDHENHADLRELRINVVARTRLEDPDFPLGRAQARENRNDAAFVSDGFRRRVIVSRVRLRNVGTRLVAT